MTEINVTKCSRKLELLRVTHSQSRKNLCSQKRVFNPLKLSVYLSIPPENIGKPKGFLIFSGGIDKQNRAVIASCLLLFIYVSTIFSA